MRPNFGCSSCVLVAECRWVCYRLPSELGFSFIFSGVVLILEFIRKIPSKAGKVLIIIVLHIHHLLAYYLPVVFPCFLHFLFCIPMEWLVISFAVFAFQDINFAFSRIFHFGASLKNALMETSKHSHS